MQKFEISVATREGIEGNLECDSGSLDIMTHLQACFWAEEGKQGT